MNLNSMMNQTATYWAPSTADGFGGRIYEAPINFKCRWEDDVQFIIGPNGEKILSKARVFTQQVLVQGGYLFRGISVAADPTTVEEAMPIVRYMETPDLRNLQTLREARL